MNIHNSYCWMRDSDCRCFWAGRRAREVVRMFILRALVVVYYNAELKLRIRLLYISRDYKMCFITCVMFSIIANSYQQLLLIAIINSYY